MVGVEIPEVEVEKMKGCEGGHVSARNEEEHVFVDTSLWYS